MLFVEWRWFFLPCERNNENRTIPSDSHSPHATLCQTPPWKRQRPETYIKSREELSSKPRNWGPFLATTKPRFEPHRESVVWTQSPAKWPSVQNRRWIASMFIEEMGKSECRIASKTCREHAKKICGSAKKPWLFHWLLTTALQYLLYIYECGVRLIDFFLCKIEYNCNETYWLSSVANIEKFEAMCLHMNPQLNANQQFFMGALFFATPCILIKMGDYRVLFTVWTVPLYHIASDLPSLIGHNSLRLSFYTKLVSLTLQIPFKTKFAFSNLLSSPS